nr:hypothetical protein Iba_chr12dCG9100 [Ipomoea batatas]
MFIGGDVILGLKNLGGATFIPVIFCGFNSPAAKVQSPGVSQDLRTTFSATTAQFVEFSKELKRLMQRVPKAVCKCSSKPMDHFSNHFSSLGELHEKFNISINGISTLRCYCDDPNDAKRENKRRFREERGQGKKVKTTITLSGDVVPYIPYEEAVRKGFVEIENLPIWAKRWDSKIPGDILGSRNKINDILKKVQEKAKQKQEYHGLKLKN